MEKKKEYHPEWILQQTAHTFIFSLYHLLIVLLDMYYDIIISLSLQSISGFFQQYILPVQATRVHVWWRWGDTSGWAHTRSLPSLTLTSSQSSAPRSAQAWTCKTSFSIAFQSIQNISQCIFCDSWEEWRREYKAGGSMMGRNTICVNDFEKQTHGTRQNRTVEYVLCFCSWKQSQVWEVWWMAWTSRAWRRDQREMWLVLLPLALRYPDCFSVFAWF